jgi:hypothetical protein
MHGIRNALALTSARGGSSAALGVLLIVACSSSGSNASGGYPYPMIGEPVTDCAVVLDAGPDAGLVVQAPTCAPPALCAGFLIGPNSGDAFCTLDCMSAACPSGFVCETTVNHYHCLKKCSSNSDCTSPFKCMPSVGNATNVCWSPYSGTDGTFDAGTGG